MMQAGPMTDAIPASGVGAGFVPGQGVTVPGPVMEMAVVHQVDGVSHSVESRTMPIMLEDGTIREFKPHSPAGKRRKSWFNGLNQAITVGDMLDAFLWLYGEKQLGEIQSGAYSAEDTQKLVSKVQVMKDSDDLPVRKAEGKGEVVAKDKKHVRSVVDSTAEVFHRTACASGCG